MNLQTFLDVREMLVSFLEEDIGTGDITSNTVIPATLSAHAKIICKSDGAIVCGLEEASMIFDICNCKSEVLVQDGTKVKKGTAIMKIAGNARSILKAERTALNVIMRMSGIATETRRYVDAVKGSCKIAATRKTAPGLRYLDKKAVVMGGGYTHRKGLDDMVLIKDNHIALTGSVKQCVALAKKNSGSAVKVECEARNRKEVIEAAGAGADIVLLDNFTAQEAARTIRKIRTGLRAKVAIEISGGINLRNIRQYAKAKPDIISVGSITHSPKAVDVSLEISHA